MKRGGRKSSMIVEDLDSVSPVSFEQQTTTKVSKFGASGSINRISKPSVRKTKLAIKCGEGVLPTYFDIYTPKRLRDKTQVHFSPRLTAESNVEGREESDSDDLEITEMESIVNNKSASGDGAPILNLRRGSKIGSSAARMKLAKLGKSLSFGSNLMKPAKKHDNKVGETQKKLSFVVKSISGVVLRDLQVRMSQ